MIEMIYYMCHRAYLLGDRRQASLCFDLLKEEIRQGAQKDALSRRQLLVLREIRDALQTGFLGGRSWVEEGDLPPEGAEKPDGKQDDLVRRIHKEAIGDIEGAVGQSLRLENLEHPCPPYGRADMLYMSQDTAYPVEVKRGDGGHDLIGQILKYGLYMRLKLNYHLYECVRPVTICAGYSPHVLNELKAGSVETLVHSELQGRVKVIKI